MHLSAAAASDILGLASAASTVITAEEQQEDDDQEPVVSTATAAIVGTTVTTQKQDENQEEAIISAEAIHINGLLKWVFQWIAVTTRDSVRRIASDTIRYSRSWWEVKETSENPLDKNRIIVYNHEKHLYKGW